LIDTYYYYYYYPLLEVAYAPTNGGRSHSWDSDWTSWVPTVSAELSPLGLGWAWLGHAGLLTRSSSGSTAFSVYGKGIEEN